MTNPYKSLNQLARSNRVRVKPFVAELVKALKSNEALLDRVLASTRANDTDRKFDLRFTSPAEEARLVTAIEKWTKENNTVNQRRIETECPAALDAGLSRHQVRALMDRHSSKFRV